MEKQAAKEVGRQRKLYLSPEAIEHAPTTGTGRGNRAPSFLFEGLVKQRMWAAFSPRQDFMSHNGEFVERFMGADICEEGCPLVTGKRRETQKISPRDISP